MRRQFADAVKICRLGLLAHPTLLEGRVVLATALTALGRWDEVLAEMRAALELAPDSADAWLLKSEALIQKSDFRQAEQALARAKQLDPANPRCEQLLGEIELARAAGFEGTPAEPTGTKVYPAARATPTAEEPGLYDEPEPGDEESTMVDANPTGALLLGASPAVMMPVSKVSSGPWLDEISDDELPGVPDAPESPDLFSFDESEDLASSEDVATNTFERPTSTSPMSDAFDTAGPVLREDGDDEAGDEPTRVRSSETGSIELSSADLLGVHTGGKPRLEIVDLYPESSDESTEVTDGDEDSDDDATRERQPFAIAKKATKGAKPAPPTGRAPTGAVPVPAPVPTPKSVRPASVTMPVRTIPPTTPVPRAVLGVPRAQVALLGGAAIAVVLLGVVFGLFVRSWRGKTRLASRIQQAAIDTSTGDYQGLSSAARLYRQILDEKDDPTMRGLEGRTLAELAYEFGDSPERAVLAAAQSVASDPGDEAKIFLALLNGSVDAAELQSAALSRQRSDAGATYLAGRVQLARDHADRAAELFRQTLARAPRDVPALFALGIADSELGHQAKALESWNRVLELSPTHAGARAARAALVRAAGTPEDAKAAMAVLAALIATPSDELAPAERVRAELGLSAAAVAAGDVVGARAALARARQVRKPRDTTTAESLAEGYLAALQLDEADEEARRALAGAGMARIGPRRVLAELALYRERPADALAVLDGSSLTPKVLILEARAILQQRGAVDGIRRNLLVALRDNPNDVGLRVMLARCDLADGRHATDGQRELERLHKVAPLVEVDAALGAAYAAHPQKADHASGLRLLTDAARRQPLGVEIRLDLVRVLRAEGKLAEARAELEEVLRLAPKLAPARRLQARVALEAGDAKTARALYDDIAATTPDPDALLGGAEAALAEGDAAGADLRVNQALALRPTLGEVASVMRARALIIEHRQDEAVSLLGAVVRNAQSGETPALLMLAYLERGDAGRAFQVPILAPARVRQSAEVLAARARLHLERGHDIAAEAVAREALAAMDKKPTAAWIQSEALVVLGRSLWDQGTFKPALKVLRRAVELTPKSARAYHSLGLVLDETRHDAEAQKAFETALALDDKIAESQFFLGRVRTRLGDPHAADAFRAYLELAPRGLYAADARAALGEGKPPVPKAKAKGPKPSSSPPRIRRRGP